MGRRVAHTGARLRRDRQFSLCLSFF
jgi:hypothetical protein